VLDTATHRSPFRRRPWARSLDFLFGPPTLKHMFVSYADQAQQHPGGHDRRAVAARGDRTVRPAVPEQIRTLRDENIESRRHAHALEAGSGLGVPPPPARPPGEPDWRSRPHPEPGEEPAPPAIAAPHLGMPPGLATAGALRARGLLLADRRLLIPLLWQQTQSAVAPSCRLCARHR